MLSRYTWTTLFVNSMFSSFCVIVLSLSLGYGHMTPDTDLGQLLTVLYALVGIQLTMLALKTMGEIIANCIRWLILGIEKLLFRVKQVHRIRLKTFLGTCALMILFLVLRSLVEIYIEKWTFVRGIYAWFSIISTIGFGDYIPFQYIDQRIERKEILWVFIFFMALFTLAGLSVVSGGDESCFLST